MKVDPKAIEKISYLAGVMIGIAVTAVPVYIILIALMGVKVTYWQVWGGLTLILILRNFLLNPH